jgi:hypothetical protein
MKTLYALVFKDTGEIVTPTSFKEHWKNYGSNSLQGWKPPKKVYYKLCHAKSGFSHIPAEIKSEIVIAEFTSTNIVVDGAELKKVQLVNHKKLQKERELKSLEFQLVLGDRTDKEIEDTVKEIKDLKSQIKLLKKD